MTEFEYEVDHVKHSVGGKSGHIFRRLFHIGMAAIPWLYYAHGESISDFLSLSSPVKVAAILGISVFFFEAINSLFTSKPGTPRCYATCTVAYRTGNG